MDIVEVRKRFLNEFVTARFNYHEEDARRVRESDYHVKRFILHKDQGSNKAFYHMKDTFKWKKKSGIHDFNPLDIPREVYQLSPIFVHEPDRNGVVPVYIRMSTIVKIDKLESKMKQFFAHTLDSIDDKLRKPRSWSMVFDATGASMENANFDLLFYAMDIIGNHFPLQPKYILVVNIPWIFKPFVKMGLSLIPPEAMELLRFLDDSEQLFTEYFDKELVPDFMGGNSTSYKKILPGAKSFIDVGKKLFKINEEECRSMFEPLLLRLKQLSDANNTDNNNDESSSSSEPRQAASFIEEFD